MSNRIPVRWSPRPIRAARRTRIAQQIADRAFAVVVCAFVLGTLRLLDLMHTLAPISAEMTR